MKNGPNGRNGQGRPGGRGGEGHADGRAMSSAAAGRVFGRHGGYRNLKAYQLAEMLYDYTCRFCDRYIPRSDRHHDQMVQSARSGYQNLAEGSEDSATSRKLELNLTNVSKGSIGELMRDYRKHLNRRQCMERLVKNPYFELHEEFRRAGAEVLLSSGQACVLFGIAAFSKDGDWIVRENEASCSAVLAVLAGHHAQYRLGVPLHRDWLGMGLTSHFEYTNESGFRMRTDFCSRPPRVDSIERMWACAARVEEIDVIDVRSLIQLKQTRRMRDYSVIGALAEVAGLEGGVAELALDYLQDYEMLSRAVRKWPTEAAGSHREAVRLLVGGAPRAQVVASLAIEQDRMMQDDQRRIDRMQSLTGDYAREFARLRSLWRRDGADLHEQHRQLQTLAARFIEG